MHGKSSYLTITNGDLKERGEISIRYSPVTFSRLNRLNVVNSLHGLEIVLCHEVFVVRQRRRVALLSLGKEPQHFPGKLHTLLVVGASIVNDAPFIEPSRIIPPVEPQYPHTRVVDRYPISVTHASHERMSFFTLNESLFDTFRKSQ